MTVPGTQRAHRRGPTIWIRRSEPRPSPVYDTYWNLAAERQNIYFRRLNGMAPPWTDDTILATFKFTNAYRALDRTSQYLIRNVIYAGDSDDIEVIFRTILFKIFNRIQTWEQLTARLGCIGTRGFDPRQYADALDAVRAEGTAIYSAAYIMPPVTAHPSVTKHRGHLALVAQLLSNRVLDSLARSKSLEEIYEHLRACPSFGSFLAYQFAVDINYGPGLAFAEAEFVVAGPGAREGISKCFISRDGWTNEELIFWTVDRQDMEFERLDLSFQNLWGRSLQPIDVQNLFCETAKYARVAHPSYTRPGGRSHIKQRFRPADVPFVKPWFPPSWEVNALVASSGIELDSSA
jgi:alpha-glutamyl/putrescinyl thymine pyrophosphorylase clade 1